MIADELRLRVTAMHLEIGDETSMMGAHISLREADTIRLELDCMLSGNIRMDASEKHSILDAATGRRLNRLEGLEIGDHVWIAQGGVALNSLSVERHLAAVRRPCGFP